MAGVRLHRGIAVFLFVSILAAGGPAPASAEPLSEAEALNHEMYRLFLAGKYKEAVEVEERELALQERQTGPDDPGLGLVLNNLADLNRRLGRFADAEPLLKRSLAIREKALGPEHRDVAATLTNLGLL